MKLIDGKVSPKPKKEWFKDENGRFKWSLGCSLSKGGVLSVDVDKIKKKQSSECPNICYKDNLCTHFVYKNGYCYLKMFKLTDASPKVAVYDNPDGLCGFIVHRPVHY